MRAGIIHAYTPDTGVGVIKTPEKERFVFTKLDWRTEGVLPALGLVVNFYTNGLRAEKVTLAESESPKRQA